jgi:D-amino-acid dehydrogenase
MKALVLGAGLVGVTTAYELLKDGYDVTVVEREDQAAQFTSFANAGLFAPGHAYAWSSPQAPRILMRSLWRNDQALRLRPTLDPAMWRWMWKFYRQCTVDGARVNTTRKVRLCNYSQDVFHDTVAKTGVEYDGNTGGLVYFYRSQATFEAAAAKADILRDNGCEVRPLDRAETTRLVTALEPAKEQIAGALYTPEDESGDACLFTRRLAEWCERNGATFKYSTTVTGLDVDGDAVTAVRTDKGPLSADVYVLSLGVYSPHIARPLGVDLPIYPVKGYSVTAPIAGRNNPPAIGVVDEENLVAFCPMGNRLRFTATAEFSGYSNAHRPSDFRHMLAVAKALFPSGADYANATYWAGLRPMTPEGTPIFGRGRHRNFWYNTGQGHMGWTMCHGSARITADLIAGKQPAIDLTGMTVAA